ncbi:GDP-mannose 4,6-dehydratase [bacterium]|nr:GDP-mannose 4,6-dehydratase [bacterium]
MSQSFSIPDFPVLTDERLWLVTGGGGFIGSHLVEHLLRNGQRVRVVDNFSTGKEENLSGLVDKMSGARSVRDLQGRLEVLKGDIREFALCCKAVEGVDYILHQAALGSVPRSFATPVETHEVNVSGFVHLLEAARREYERSPQLRSLVYASSSSVYGDHPALPKQEMNIGRMLSPYAASKRADELYAQSFESVSPFPIVGLRYFNVFGPRQNPTGAYAAVIPRWVAALRAGEKCAIYGDGETSRDFCYVENVVLANLLAALAGQDTLAAFGSERVFNIAGGEQTSLLELYGLLFSELGISGSREERCEFRDFREGDVRHSLADISQAKEVLGYAPRVSVREGITKVVHAQ